MFDADLILEANGLEFTSLRVDQNPYMPHDSDDLAHYLCSVSGGAVDDFEFYISLGDDFDGSPAASFAISLVMEDVGAFRNCKGYHDFAKLVGVEEDEGSGRVAYEELGRLSEIITTLENHASAKISVP